MFNLSFRVIIGRWLEDVVRKGLGVKAVVAAAAEVAAVAAAAEVAAAAAAAAVAAASAEAAAVAVAAITAGSH